MLQALNIILILLIVILLIIICNCKNKENFQIKIIDRIYFINLDKSKDRLKIMEDNAKKNSLTLTRFPAFNGKDLNKEKLYKNGMFSDFIYKSRDGMIGCTVSHIELWKKIVKENDNIVLILEDDVIIKDNFSEEFNKYYRQAPDNWDILYLGASNVYGKKISKNLIKPIYGTKGLTNVGAYAILVKKESLKKMISAMTPVTTDFDVQLRNNYNKFNNVYYFNPPLILHNNNINSDRRVIDGKSPKAGYLWRNDIQNKVTIV